MASAESIGRVRFWIGWTLSVLPALLLAMGGVMNILQPEFAVQGATDAGYARHTLLPLGIVLLLAVATYLVPKTAALGAIVLTGYLGGAVATHVINGDPLGMMLFPVVFAAVLWTGLVLRSPRVCAAVFPFSKTTGAA